MFAQIFTALLLICVTSQTTLGSPVKDTLLRDLLHDYEKDVDPGNITLHFGLAYNCANLDRETGHLTSSLWEQYFWQDPRLRWVPAEHAGVRQLRVPAKRIWTPDFKLYNSNSAEREEVNTVISSDGSVIWIPSATYKSFCSRGHTDQDTTCKFRVGSWTYDAEAINLQLSERPFDTDAYIDYCPYTVSDAKYKIESKKYPCCPELYSTFEVEFKVHASE
jgi:nicotinic acetylcholine receptor